jgi:hypothetical protein
VGTWAVFLAINVALTTLGFCVQRRALLDIVIDPTDRDVPAMRQAMAGYALHATTLVALLVLALVAALHRLGGARVRRIADALVVLAAAGVGLFVFIDGRVFADYGVHTYDFDVLAVVSNTVLTHDLGIRPRDIALAVFGGVLALGAQVGLLLAVRRWGAGVRLRHALAALLAFQGVGTATHLVAARGIRPENRAEFAEVLPYRNLLLLRPRARPHLDVVPRLGPGGYPLVGRHGEQAPTLRRPRDIVVVVADALRADLAHALAARLNAFGQRRDAIAPERFYGSGHTTDSGVFGLLYGINGQHFYPFLEARVPSYPLDVLRANGYVLTLLAGSGLAPYPTDHLTRLFDEVRHPASDDEVERELQAVRDRRRVDGRPSFVFALFYTTHWPYASVQPHNARFAPALDERTRSSFQPMQEAAFRRRVLNSARNSVLEMDERFGRVADALADDLRGGRTILIATADHGTDLWEHGSFGHGRSSFWNAKFRIPFVVALGGDSIPDARRTPGLASQLDLWPTLLDALAATPRPDPRRYSDGVSLLTADRAALEARTLLLAGRFYPWADRPSALVAGGRKYWFTTRRSDTEALAFDVIRTTDLDDRAVPPDRAPPAAFDSLRAGYWKFLRPRADAASSPGRR